MNKFKVKTKLVEAVSDSPRSPITKGKHYHVIIDHELSCDEPYNFVHVLTDDHGFDVLVDRNIFTGTGALTTGEEVNGTWWARQLIDNCPFLGEADTEDEAINDLMEAAGVFRRDGKISADSKLWG